MELQAVSRPDPARERCPYCRDELAGPEASPEDLVECQACGTAHHAACLEELGRCTVLGCGGGPPARGTPVGEAGRPVPSRLRAARERIRSRARAFAREHVRPRPEMSMLEARVRAGLEGMREAEREGRWGDALEFLRDLRELTPKELEEVRGVPDESILSAREARLERLMIRHQALRLVLIVGGVLGLLWVIAMAVLLTSR